MSLTTGKLSRLRQLLVFFGRNQQPLATYGSLTQPSAALSILGQRIIAFGSFGLPLADFGCPVLPSNVPSSEIYIPNIGIYINSYILCNQHSNWRIGEQKMKRWMTKDGYRTMIARGQKPSIFSQGNRARHVKNAFHHTVQCKVMYELVLTVL